MISSYYYGDGVKIRQGSGLILLNVELPDGVTLTDVEPRRMMPISNLNSYIALFDGEGNEMAVIRDANRLDRASKNILDSALNKYYMMPHILEIKNSSDKTGILTWKVVTDRGPYEFNIANRNADIKTLNDGRILIRDANDNRYEIPDIETLNAYSRNVLLGDL